MKLGDFNSTVENVPTYVAVYRVKKVPEWATPYVDIGEYLVLDRHLECFHIKNSRGPVIVLGASYVDFYGYFLARDWR